PWRRRVWDYTTSWRPSRAWLRSRGSSACCLRDARPDLSARSLHDALPILGGGADANGREVEGLGALAQSRGARAVMATLWPVAEDRKSTRLNCSHVKFSHAVCCLKTQTSLFRYKRLPPCSCTWTDGCILEN